LNFEYEHEKPQIKQIDADLNSDFGFRISDFRPPVRLALITPEKPMDFSVFGR